MNKASDLKKPEFEQFFIAGRSSGASVSKDRYAGAATFLRFGEGERIDLVASILETWMEGGDLNHAMACGALRHAWDSEPYIQGARMGSYVTSAAARLHDQGFSYEEFIEEWGSDLMTDDEVRKLQKMQFPLTIYRGGAGTFDDVAAGFCWTLKPEIASFYAHEWPQRWGRAGDGVIVRAEVDEGDVYAFLDDRNEAELLIPYPDQVENLKQWSA